jgi:chromosome partitioning protein
MRILGVLNHKGGTGKTTTVVNVADGLVRHGARVLMIDLDAQGNLASSLGVPFTATLSHHLLDDAPLPTCTYPARPNLDVIPSDGSLMEVEGMLWRLDDCQQARQHLRQKLGDVTGYDFVIIDFPPSASLLSQNGLLFCRELIVPVSMDYLALMGTRQVIETLKEIGRIPDHQLRLSLVVPTFFYGRLRKDRAVISTLQKYFNRQVADPIRANVKLAEAPGHHKSIFEYAPNSPGAADYQQLVKRIVNNGN